MCYIRLCCTMPLCNLLCYSVTYFTIQCYAILYHTLPFYAIVSYAIISFPLTIIVSCGHEFLVISGFKKILGPVHPDTMQSIRTLSLIHATQGLNHEVWVRGRSRWLSVTTDASLIVDWSYCTRATLACDGPLLHTALLYPSSAWHIQNKLFYLSLILRYTHCSPLPLSSAFHTHTNFIPTLTCSHASSPSHTRLTLHYSFPSRFPHTPILLSSIHLISLPPSHELICRLTLSYTHTHYSLTHSLTHSLTLPLIPPRPSSCSRGLSMHVPDLWAKTIPDHSV